MVVQYRGLANNTIAIFQNPADGAVVFSGCGTSGRIGFITSVKSDFKRIAGKLNFSDQFKKMITRYKTRWI